MRCPDPPVHPAAAGVLRGPLLAAGWLAALALGVYVADAAVSFLAAVTAGILAVDAVVAVVLVRLVRYGGWRKPASSVGASRRTSNGTAVRVAAALPAPPLAIEQARPVVTGVVVAEGETIGR